MRLVRQCHETIQELITTVRALRKELSVPEKEVSYPFALFMRSPTRLMRSRESNHDMLARLCRVSAVESAADPSPVTTPT